eukprot:1394199-Amorphochlora_amoeboformis.AAC.1
MKVWVWISQVKSHRTDFTVFRVRIIQEVLVRGPLTPSYSAVWVRVRVGWGWDYSACLSPRTIDSSTEWGCSAVWDNSSIVLLGVLECCCGVRVRVRVRGLTSSLK